MIHILQDIIKTLHENMLKVINLNWFCNYTSERNTSLINDHLREPWKKDQGLLYLLSGKIYMAIHIKISM